MLLFRLCITILFVFLVCKNSFALTLNEAITSAKTVSTEVEIEKTKSELAEISKADAATMFLPELSVDYLRGDRKVNVTGVYEKKMNADSRTITLQQPVFDGFQGIAKIDESINRTKSAQEEYQFKKNEISLTVADYYLNILRLRKIVEIEKDEINHYSEVIKLLKHRLALNDISYDEFSDYESRNQNIVITSLENKTKLKDYEVKFENTVKQKPDNLSYPMISEFNQKNYEEFLSQAHKENPRIKSTFYAMKAAKSALAAEGGKVLPKVSFVAQKENQKSSFYFNGRQVQNDSAYFNIHIPIFQSGSEYAMIAKANKQKQIQTLQNRLAKEEVENNLKKEYQNFASLKESLESSKQVLNHAIESVKLAEERFAKKDIGKFDLLIRKIDVIEIEKKVANLETEMLISYYKIKELINEI